MSRAVTSRRPCASQTGSWPCAAASFQSPARRSPCTPSSRTGSHLEGESQIEHARGIKRIWITPEDVRPADEALKAIANADVVVIGPGSLYTSLLPPLLVPGMREALATTNARTAVRVQRRDAAGRDRGLRRVRPPGRVDDRTRSRDLLDAVLVNNNTRARQLPSDPASPVSVDIQARQSLPPLIVERDVVDDGNAHRHDSRKLTAAIIDLYDEHILVRHDQSAAA